MSGATSWLQVARGKCSRSNYWGEWDPAPVERVGHSVCTDWADALRGQAVQRVGLVRLKGAKDLHTAHLRTWRTLRYCTPSPPAPHDEPTANRRKNNALNRPDRTTHPHTSNTPASKSLDTDA